MLPSPIIRALSSPSRYWNVSIFTSPCALLSLGLWDLFTFSATFLFCCIFDTFKLVIWGLMSLTGIRSSPLQAPCSQKDMFLDSAPDLPTTLEYDAGFEGVWCGDVEGVWRGVWSCVWNLFWVGCSLTPEWAAVGSCFVLGVVPAGRWGAKWKYITCHEKFQIWWEQKCSPIKSLPPVLFGHCQ